MDPSPSVPSVAVAAAVFLLAELPEVLGVEARSRLVDERSALEALRTPPAEPPIAPIEAEELSPPLEPPPPITLEELATLEATELVEVDEEPLEPDDPALEETDPPLPPDPPPPPRRPMNAPPPPEKLRLPRSCGPRIVLNFSGPVVPVSRIVLETLPLLAVVLRTAASATFGAAACSAVRRCHKKAPPAIRARTINHPHGICRLGRSTGETGVSFRSGGAGVEGAGALDGCMTETFKARWILVLPVLPTV